MDKRINSPRISSSETDGFNLPNSRSTSIKQSETHFDSLHRSVNDQSEFLYKSLVPKIDKLTEDIKSLLELREIYHVITHPITKLVLGILILTAGGLGTLGLYIFNNNLISPLNKLQESSNQQSQDLVELRANISFIKDALSTTYKIPAESEGKKP